MDEVGEPGKPAPVRVVVVDDHPLFRSGLRAALDSGEGVRVVGEAGDAHDVEALVAGARPDVVVMDLHLPGVPGCEAVRRLTAAFPGLPVLMLTMSQDDGSLLAALRAGARGYLVKGAGRDAVLNAVRATAAGGAVFGAEVAERVTSLLLGEGSGGARRMPSPGPLATLTEREREVLDLMARGADNRHIARTLCLADKTVRNHVSSVFGKLAVEHRAQAVVVARDAGWGEGQRRTEG
ncbi:response regulator transcription factor [Streptomyces sp. CA-278952]|uniref:response regulator transcription factor n=1 Tax=Streptomyces sp. CA-278952 TaxID=2980556 RepID=UPI002367BF00|nr:response regulator transcription factor [Streptomyces sp. CA-278952]WDG29663.1 response regulator transcription factor [Streptomyces sp. CA-278952]